VIAKVGAALVAIAADFYCIWLVRTRAKVTDDTRLRELTRKFRMWPDSRFHSVWPQWLSASGFWRCP